MSSAYNSILTLSITIFITQQSLMIYFAKSFINILKGRLGYEPIVWIYRLILDWEFS